MIWRANPSDMTAELNFNGKISKQVHGDEPSPYYIQRVKFVID